MKLSLIDLWSCYGHPKDLVKTLQHKFYMGVGGGEASKHFSCNTISLVPGKISPEEKMLIMTEHHASLAVLQKCRDPMLIEEGTPLVNTFLCWLLHHVRIQFLYHSILYCIGTHYSEVNTYGQCFPNFPFGPALAKQALRATEIGLGIKRTQQFALIRNRKRCLIYNISHLKSGNPHNFDTATFCPKDMDLGCPPSPCWWEKHWKKCNYGIYLLC